MRVGGQVFVYASVVFATFLLAAGSIVHAQPPLEDFVALASKDEKVSEAAAARLSPVWKDSYAAMVIDLARFFRPARTNGAAARAEDSLGEDDPQTGSAPRGTRSAPFVAGARTPESAIRGRLIRFLARQTKKSFGDDLKKWRKWSWTLPYEPHPEYSAFKARLYANVDPRMASFFEAAANSRIRLDEIDWGGVGVNGIPPLDHPKTLPATEAKFMGDKNVVFGVVISGQARAYPKRILAWHEMALDIARFPARTRRRPERSCGDVDSTVLTCPSCQGRMRLLAVVKNPVSIARYLAAAGELTEVPSRAPGRGPPYWKSQVLRRQALGNEGHGGDHDRGDEAA